MISGVSNSPYRYSKPVARANDPMKSPAVLAMRDKMAMRAHTVPVQAGGNFDPSALMDTIKGIFSSIGNFLVNMWNKLTGKTSTPAVPEEVTRIAAQYNLLPTKENVDAFVQEVKSYDVPGPGGFQTLGPNSPNIEATTQVQTILKSWGYQVTPSGQYDAATQTAVKQFKIDNGLHQTYKLSNGSFDVNVYFDYSTFQVMQAKAAGVAPGNPGPTPSPTPAPAPTPGTLNWQAIATQYSLLSSEENVKAFLAEVKTYQAPDANGFQVMGPGYPNAAEITEVQNALTKVGFPVTATGQWDATTSQAIIGFKTKQGLHQNYKSPDGNWAVNEYADFQTLQQLSTLV